ncbi:UPF0659 protein [Ceratocystis lukuohia]|uniref:UPF0659 protein n=1 Tax=Ceratocystis lukuohia TaxID=2019550 RepID=A0ABR4MFN6_9PEZI
MPTTLIFGGSGKVARHLTRLLVTPTGAVAGAPKAQHTVYSIIRDPAQSSALTDLGATPLVQSIESATVAELAATIQKVNPDFVVWSAGAGAGSSPERTQAVDRDGAIKVMDALAAARPAGSTDTAADDMAARRFIIVSAVDIRDRTNKPEPVWYTEADSTMSTRVWGAIGKYMEAKLGADRSLYTDNARRRLAYTIVRPGGLSDDPGTGKVRAGRVGLVGFIPREDVARTVVACIENPQTVGLAIDFLGEGEGAEPLEQAVERVARERVDCFEGFY